MSRAQIAQSEAESESRTQINEPARFTPEVRMNQETEKPGFVDSQFAHTTWGSEAELVTQIQCSRHAIAP